MPLKINNEGGATEYLLDVVTFNSEYNIFILESATNKNIKISFDYNPPVEKWDHTKYEMFLFENAYLNAENDIFEIYIKEISSERMGWIFPITILESEEGAFKETPSKNKALNGYRFVAFNKLLSYDKTISLNNGQTEYKITDIYDDATIVCLISKDAVNNKFKINDHILSFYSYGYCIFKEHPRCIPFEGNSIIDEIRGKERIKLIKSNFDIYTNDYIKRLFEDHLVFNNEGLVRFVFLYQIIEHFIKIEYDCLFNENLKRYQDGVITPNDLREKINSLGNEKIRISQVLNNANISQNLKEKFEKDCISLFNDISYNCEENFPTILYALRNKITHEYRELFNCKDRLNEVIYLFEKVIIELLMTYNEKKKIQENKNEKSDVPSTESNVGDNPIDDDIFRIPVSKLKQPKVLYTIDIDKVNLHRRNTKQP